MLNLVFQQQANLVFIGHGGQLWGEDRRDGLQEGTQRGASIGNRGQHGGGFHELASAGTGFHFGQIGIGGFLSGAGFLVIRRAGGFGLGGVFWGFCFCCFFGVDRSGALGTLLLGLPGDFLSSWAAMDHLMQLIFVTLCASLSFGVFFWIRRRVDQLQLEAAQERERAETAARQAAEARLAVLRAQIEPHMLFNTLANLRALIVLDPAAAQHMLDRLIAFMRATLSSSRSERVSLQAEFTLIDDYLHLIGIRMGERLRHRLDLPTTLASVTTLPLLLQPLVENAVRHGLEPAEQGGEIEVSARRLGDRLELSVTNSGAPFRAERDAHTTGRRLAAGADGTVHQEGGFGLSQIRQRLQTAYGDAAKLEIRAAQAGDGCRVTLILPLVEAVPASASPSSPSSPSSGA